VQIAEPVTTLTDYALGAFSVYFASRLYSPAGPKRSIPRQLWSIAFGAAAVASFAGGTFHGFPLMIGPSTLRALWNVTVFSIGASTAFMIGGVMASSIHKKHPSRRWLYRGFFVTLAGFVVQLTGFRRGVDFNHNDVFHVIQIIGFYLFFRGAGLLEDRRNGGVKMGT
jgi:hypothetical protein